LREKKKSSIVQEIELIEISGEENSKVKEVSEEEI